MQNTGELHILDNVAICNRC